MTPFVPFTALLLQLAAPAPPRPNAAPSPVPNCFPAEAQIDEFRTQWYCAHLLAAGESRLTGDRVYRFTYLPTFRHPRVVVASQQGSEWTITGKVLAGRGGYQPGTVSRETERRLSADEIRLLEQRLENAGAWEPDPPKQERGEDGSIWLLEVKRGTRYLLHEVWSPTETTFPQYRRACTYMLQLAGILADVEEGDLY